MYAEHSIKLKTHTSNLNVANNSLFPLDNVEDAYDIHTIY